MRMIILQIPNPKAVLIGDNNLNASHLNVVDQVACGTVGSHYFFLKKLRN